MQREGQEKHAHQYTPQGAKALFPYAAEKFIYLVAEEERENVLCACWVHDIIEDARETYNDVKKNTNETVAELAFALTNEKGKNRNERANDKYYQEMQETPNAVFIKYCDNSILYFVCFNNILG